MKNKIIKRIFSLIRKVLKYWPVEQDKPKKLSFYLLMTVSRLLVSCSFIKKIKNNHQIRYEYNGQRRTNKYSLHNAKKNDCMADFH